MTINQEGFGIIEGILVVVVVALLGFIGFQVYQSNQKNRADADTKLEISKELKKTTNKKEVKRYDLGEYSFILPEEWTSLQKKSDNPEIKSLASYSFQIPSNLSDLDDSSKITLEGGEISLFKLEDSSFDMGSQIVYVHDPSSRNWVEETKKPLSVYDNLLLNVYGDGGYDGNDYSNDNRVYRVMGDDVVVVHYSENAPGGRSSDKSYTVDFGSKIVKSNEFLEQIVELLDSVK